MLLRVLLTVHAFDRERDLPPSMQFDFGEAIRKHLVLPQPLGADAYESSSNMTFPLTAHLTLHGNYAATITADGHVIKAVTIGGAHNPDFDNAVLKAMGAIDSTDMLSATDAGLPNEDVDVRVEIMARDTLTKAPLRTLGMSVTLVPGRLPNPDAPPTYEPFPSDSEPGTPLFSFRVPVRAVTQRLGAMPGNSSLRYPSGNRQPGAKGQVEAEFVVDAEGHVEPASVQVVDATQRDFAKAVLDAMPHFLYKPLTLNGCPVRSLVREAFQFYMSK